MTDDQQFATMSIVEVVNQPGGNGLVSPPFQPPIDFLGIFGWQNVESGVEALIYDGKLMPFTRFKTDILRLIGRRRFVRRVLLKPAPLEITATSLTADQLELSLEVAVKFEVKDPVHVASLENPLGELTNVAVGLISEYIRERSLTELIADRGQTRKELLTKLVTSTSITQHYDIIEVLKALPTGDERLIETNRLMELEKTRKSLTEAEGENKLIAAQFQAEILRGEAQIQDEFAEREHQRQLEKTSLEGRMNLAQTAIETLGQVAASGIDPMPLAEDIINKLADPSRKGASASQQERPLHQDPDKITEGEHSQVQVEREMMESIKENIQMTAYEVVASDGKVKGAVIQMSNYEIVFTCDKDYPKSPPQIIVRFPDGQTRKMNGAWISGVTTSMAQSILVIAAQVSNGKA